MATVAGILVHLILVSPVLGHFSDPAGIDTGRNFSGLRPNELSEALKESFSDFQVLKIFHKPEERTGIIRDLNGSKSKKIYRRRENIAFNFYVLVTV